MERAEAAVGTVLDAEDAADLVRIARHVRARVTTEGLGGAAVGPVCADTITVRTDRLNRISICPRSRSARVGAGVSAGELAAALAPHGLIATSGDALYTGGVAELALTGAIGRFARKHGLASDDVTAFEVVDADGNLLRASAHENEDLFWALSGGGAGFGLVTAVEVQLHAEPEMFDTTIVWPAAATREVLAALADVATSAPEELAVRVTVAPGSGAEATVAVSATFLGAEEDARVLLKPFKDVGGEVVVAADRLVEPVADPARAVLLSGLDDNVPTLAALPSLHLRHLGGRLAEPSAKGPHGALDGEFAVFLGEPAPRTFRAREWERLREVKAVWDPDGAFAGGGLG
jgi:FAD/FMN-containing dehydrogenase